MTNFGVYGAEVEPTVPVAEVEKKEPASTGTVQLINKMSIALDVTLQDGTNLHLGPRVRGLSLHKSRVILRKQLPDYVNKLVAKGEVKVVNC